MVFYVVVPDYGYEGYGAPIKAFKTLAEAEDLVATMKKVGGDYDIVPTPLAEG